MASYTLLSWLVRLSLCEQFQSSHSSSSLSFSVTSPSPSPPHSLSLSSLSPSPLVDLGDMESLFREFDDVLFKKAVADNRLGLLDASSLLWRLNTRGVEVGEERWKKVTDALATHIGNHRSPWLV